MGQTNRKLDTLFSRPKENDHVSVTKQPPMFATKSWKLEPLSKLLERITFTANGKSETFAVSSSAVCTVERTYLHLRLQWIVGEVIPLLCALFTD